MHAAIDLTFQNPSFFKNTEVLRDPRLRDRKSGSDLPDRHRLASEPLDDAPARGIGQSAENRVQASNVNHTVI